MPSATAGTSVTWPTFSRCGRRHGPDGNRLETPEVVAAHDSGHNPDNAVAGRLILNVAWHRRPLRSLVSARVLHSPGTVGMRYGHNGVLNFNDCLLALLRLLPAIPPPAPQRLRPGSRFVDKCELSLDEDRPPHGPSMRNWSTRSSEGQEERSLGRKR